MDLDKLLQETPYSLDSRNKELLLTEGLVELTKKHYSSSHNYRKMMDAVGLDYNKIKTYL